MSLVCENEMRDAQSVERDEGAQPGERLIDQALEALYLGEWARAASLYERAIAENPQCFFANSGLSFAHAVGGDLREAFSTNLGFFQKLVVERDAIIDQLQNRNSSDRLFHDSLYQELWSPRTLARKPFYNVGPGWFSHRHWTNIDKNTQAYPSAKYVIDIQFDPHFPGSSSI